jgi:hypothetical protein
MTRKAKPIRPRKIRRNPHARALGDALFRPRVVRPPDAYRRKPKHRKPQAEEGES